MGLRIVVTLSCTKTNIFEISPAVVGFLFDEPQFDQLQLTPPNVLLTVGRLLSPSGLSGGTADDISLEPKRILV